MEIVLAWALWAADEPREILCLYDSSEARSAAESPAACHAEIALNYLGLVAVYRDVNGPLPDEAFMRRFRGVLAWFGDARMKQPVAYWKWVGAQIRAGRKVALLGNLGATDHVPAAAVNEGLGPLGVEYAGDFTGNPTVLEVVRKDRRVEFERTLDGELRTFLRLKAAPDLEVLLRVRRTDLPGCEGDLAGVGPRGGYSLVTVHYDPRLNRTEWRLDPFAFFARAFGVCELPKPDLATAMGRRIVFVSVDGDGLLNRVQAGPNVGRYSGEVVREEFLKKFDLPVTASVIAADADREPDLVRSILSLPNVEPAVHSYRHPLKWKEGTLAYPGAFSLRDEVAGAVERVNRLSPKPVKMYLWTGDCRPPAEAIEMLDRLGVSNMNGEDADTGSVLSLSSQRGPVVRREGRLQFNARAPSEYHFTDGWTRNYFAYRNVLKVFEVTASPYPLTPLHIYFHYYVVDQPAGEAALREVFEEVARRDTFPMTASEYVAWVRGFLAARVESLPGRSWRVSEYGACRTLRFDGPEHRYVDLERSTNVLGFRSTPGWLYVHLAEGDQAVVTLSAEPPKGPYLVDSNGLWKKGKIVAQAAAAATVMTAEGPRRVTSTERELKISAGLLTEFRPALAPTPPRPP